MNKLIHALIAAGIRAPSGDNCQPWRFRVVSDEQVEVCLVPEQAASFFDLDLRASYLSIGAVVANMRSAAAFHGQDLVVEYVEATAAHAYLAARVTLGTAHTTAVAKTDAHLYHAMLARSVNRRPYLPLPLGRRDWQRLLVAAPAAGVEVVCYTGGAARRRLQRLVALADGIRWTHPQIHRELFAKVRFDHDEVEASRDGLQLDRLGLGPLAGQVMRFLSSWSRLSRLNKFGLATLLAWQTRLLMAASGGLVAVWVDADSPEAWMRGGEVVERLWVRAQSMGMQVQPLPVAFYLLRRFQYEGARNFCAGQCEALCSMRALLHDLRPSPGSHGIMLFRIGRGWPMRSLAVRRAAASFTVAEG